MYTKKRLSREERLNQQAIAQEWMLDEQPNRVLLLLMVALASFTVGLIPVAYTLATGKSLTPNSSTTVAGEAGIWGVLGEKLN